MSWERARELRKQRVGADDHKHLEAFFPQLKELFGVGEDQLAQLAQVAVAENARVRVRDAAWDLDVKEQEEALRGALKEMRGGSADPRTDRSAEKLLHALEHNQHISFEARALAVSCPWRSKWNICLSTVTPLEAKSDGSLAERARAFRVTLYTR